MWTDEVDRVLAEDYLGDLAARPIEEIRAKRDESRVVEDKVSYLRRMIQGRLDIVAADLERRTEGGAAADLRTLVEQLPVILSEKVHAGGPGRLPSGVLPPNDDDLTTELDRVVPPDTLGNLPDLSDADVAELARRLQDLERDVSDTRKALFGRIDALHAELVRRYGTGEADPGRLLDP
jgi:hypothetical protein